jgi:hypothetical protein
VVVKNWPATLLLCLSIAGSASPAAAAGGPRVTYDGPTGNVTGPVTLTAKANGSGARIVAVTFVVDGAPRGSDTTAPYSLGLNPALVRGGRHTVRVAAVDSLGRRASSSVANIVTNGGDRPLEASPRAGLAEALRALRSGDVTVRLAPGRYRLDNVVLGTSARLVGSGPSTVISPSKPGYFAILVAKGEHVRIANLTVDGGGEGRGGGNAIAVFDGSRDVRLQRLRLRHVRQNGVNVWGAYSQVSVQDSVIDGGGTGNAGIFSLGSDKSRGTSVIRTRIHGFRTFGILLGQKKYGRPSAALHDLALDNAISDIRDPARNACYKTASAPRCGTEEGGIWTGGVEAAIIGNKIVSARWDGIETVGSSTRTTIADNVIRPRDSDGHLPRARDERLGDRPQRRHRLARGDQCRVVVRRRRLAKQHVHRQPDRRRAPGGHLRRGRQRRQPDLPQRLRRRTTARDPAAGLFRQRRAGQPRLWEQRHAYRRDRRPPRRRQRRDATQERPGRQRELRDLRTLTRRSTGAPQ